MEYAQRPKLPNGGALWGCGARRLPIHYKAEYNNPQLAYTLNNTCVAPPHILITFLENHLQADGSVIIPEALRPYTGDKAALSPKA